MRWRSRRKKSTAEQLDLSFLDSIADEFARANASSAAAAASLLNRTRLESASYSEEHGSLTLRGEAGTVTISTPDRESAQNICSMPNLEDVTMFANVQADRLVVFCMSRTWQYAVKGISSTAEDANQCD